MIRLIPALVPTLLWLFCIIDVIRADEFRVRNLPKTAWILVVFFFPLVGGLAWLIAGRPEAGRPLTRQQGGAPGYPEYERSGRFAASNPEDDEAFLRQVRERAEAQRRAYEEQKRRKAAEDDS
ncbi:MAG: PLD nuclease N-terminal domain-containing protein [Nocardioides sp.]|uniref:PLD nuclease N-terminal domain-containing protein n=1 Tax=Nocardioides sp. TaxID=35761 RepID=UPI0039E326CD